MIRQLPIFILSGLLFGAGLAISGMADPQRVRGFLDVFGDWDPTLLFVMGGAVIVMMLAWPLQRRMLHPLLTNKFQLPSRKDVDRPLIVGATIFGIGWAIAGLCPGPALIGLVLEPISALIFVAAMTVGMAVYRVLPIP
ncbi:MAG: DUF6691 family protein [Parasphingorhabdus sp.]